MAKLFKFLIWTLISLVVIVALAAVLIPILVDPNDYKDEIAQQVQQKTGRTLTIDGDINLSVSLPLSVTLELGRIELSNAKGFADKPFARMDGASLYVAIWPLLTQNRLDIGEIKLNGMQLNLVKNKQGQTNWADLAGDKADTPEKSPAQTSEKTAPSAEAPAINVEGLSVTDAEISWTDHQKNQSISLSQTNISISELIEDKPFKLSFSTHIDSNNPAIKGTFSLTSEPVIALSRQLFKLPSTLLTVDLTGAMLPGGQSKTSLGGDIVFDGQAQTLDINNMKLTTFDMVINGLFKAAQLNSQPTYQGQVNIDTFSPKQLATRLGAALPAMKEANALSSANVKLTFNGNDNAVNISSLEANLDDTSLTGNAKISNFQNPFYGFDLALNQLNLDYYAMASQTQTAAQKPATESTATAPAGQKKAAQPAPIFPVELLRQLNLNGKLTIGQFIAGGARMSNVVIILKGKDGIVQLAPLTASLYQGNINLNSTIDTRGNTPKLKINNELENVQIGDLLQDTTGKQEFTGAANITTNITTAGNDADRLVKNSNGSGKLLITDGHIKKLDVLTTLRKAQALYRGTQVPTENQEQNTRFTELKGTYTITNGVFRNNDLASKSPVMELTGKGYADFPREYLDYTLNVKLLNSLRIDENSQGTDYRGKEIPYTIKGKFSELSQEANITKVLEQEVKKKISEKIDDKLGDKLNEKLGDELGDKLKGFLKGF